MPHRYHLRNRPSRPRRTDKLLCDCYDNLPLDLLWSIACAAVGAYRHRYPLRSRQLPSSAAGGGWQGGGA